MMPASGTKLGPAHGFRRTSISSGYGNALLVDCSQILRLSGPGLLEVALREIQETRPVLCVISGVLAKGQAPFHEPDPVWRELCSSEVLFTQQPVHGTRSDR